MAIDIATLKVAELKKHLQERGLSTSGLKADLASRLQDAMSSEESTTHHEPAADDETTPAQSNEDEKAHEQAANDQQVVDAQQEIVIDNVEDQDSMGSDLQNEHHISNDKIQEQPSERLLHQATEQEEKEVELGQDENHHATRQEHEEVSVPVEHDQEAQYSKEEEANTVSLEGLTPENGIVQKMDPSRSLYIHGLIRPLTLATLKEKIEQYGPLETKSNPNEQSVWLDGIKTHAYITFSDVESAIRARKDLSGTVFPSETGRKIQLFFIPYEIAERCIGIEDSAWLKDRCRMELRARIEDSRVLYSLHPVISHHASSSSYQHHTFESNPRKRKPSQLEHDYKRRHADARRPPSRIHPPDQERTLNGSRRNESSRREPFTRPEERIRQIEERILSERRQREESGRNGGNHNPLGYGPQRGESGGRSMFPLREQTNPRYSRQEWDGRSRR